MFLVLSSLEKYKGFRSSVPGTGGQIYVSHTLKFLNKTEARYPEIRFVEGFTMLIGYWPLNYI